MTSPDAGRVLEDDRGRAEVMTWGEIRVDLLDGKTSWWKYPASEFVAEGTLMSGDIDAAGLAKDLALDLIAQLKAEQEQ